MKNFTPQSRPKIVVMVLIFLMLLGLVVRLGVAWYINQRLPDTPDRLIGDEFSYDYLAYALVQGEFFQSPARTPGYPLFLAASYALLGHSYTKVLYVQAFLSVAVIPLTYLLSRWFTDSLWALLASALVTVHPALILHVPHLYSEILFTPLLVLVLISLMWALEMPHASRFILAGALLGLANLTRPTAFLFPVFLLLLLPAAWTFKRRIILCLFYGGTMALIIAPWTYHNYRTYNEFLPLSVSTAVLWQGSPEYYHLMEKRKTHFQIWQKELNPARNGGYDPFTIEGDRYFTNRAIASIRSEPGVYAWYSLKKLAFFWIGHPATDWPEYAFFSIDTIRSYFSAPRIAAIFFSRLFPFLAIVGLIILHKRLCSFKPLLVVCGYFMLVHTITYPEVRYSEPLYPILAVIVAAATEECSRFYRMGWQRSAPSTHDAGNL